MATKRLFKRTFFYNGWHWLGAETGFIEWDFVDYINDADEHKVRLERKEWGRDIKEVGTAWEWQIKGYREWDLYPEEAEGMYKKANATKYVTRKIPEELKPWFLGKTINNYG